MGIGHVRNAEIRILSDEEAGQSRGPRAKALVSLLQDDEIGHQLGNDPESPDDPAIRAVRGVSRDGRRRIPDQGSPPVEARPGAAEHVRACLRRDGCAGGEIGTLASGTPRVERRTPSCKCAAGMARADTSRGRHGRGIAGQAGEAGSRHMWNDRYATEDYLFGTEPADFLVRQAPGLAPRSRVLCVADGEGRNSVHLAALGHDVTAFDPAPNALAKAGRLAAAKGVHVALHEAGIEDWPWTPAAFDAVVAIFIQFAAPPARATLFGNIARTLRPGGLLLLHGYAPRQVGYGTGGPPHAENMYTLPLLLDAFPGWEVLHAADRDAEIDEGRGHSGRSALIDFVARKPAG